MFKMRSGDGLPASQQDCIEDPHDIQLRRPRAEFYSHFTDELPKGRLRKHEAYDKKKSELTSTPLRRKVFQLSPAKMLTAKQNTAVVLKV